MSIACQSLMEIKRDTLQLSTANFCLLNQHDYAVILAPSIHFSKFAASSKFLSFFGILKIYFLLSFHGLQQHLNAEL